MLNYLQNFDEKFNDERVDDKMMNLKDEILNKYNDIIIFGSLVCRRKNLNSVI